MLDLYGSRPADQIVSRVVRITLAGQSYELPVLSIRENRAWKEQLDAKTAGLLGALDSTDDLPAVLALLTNQSDDLLDMLLAYDDTHLLPAKDEIEALRPDPSIEILAAVREVWKAANPLVGIALETVAAAMPTSSPPTNTPPASGTSRRKRSRTN